MFCLFGLAFAWMLRPIWSIDIFFHVAIGREILEHGLPTTDVFSAAHPEASWTPFQVGYALLVAQLKELGGLDLLRAVHAALLAGTVHLLWRRLRSGHIERAAAFLLLAMFILLFEERVRLRPHVFNLCFEVGILLPLAGGAWRANRRRWLWVVFGTSLLWTFMHALGVIWLLCIVGTVALLGPSPEDRRWGIKATALTTLGIILSPGALGGITHVLSIYDSWGPFVPELAPSWAWFERESAYGWVAGTLPWCAAATVVGAALGRPEPHRRSTILAAAGLAFGAISMVRLSYYSVFVFVLLAPEWRRWLSRLPVQPRALRYGALIATLLCVSLVGMHRLPATVARGVNPWTTTLDPGAFPVAETRALRKAGIGGKIFNAPPWGGYLLCELGPGTQVLSDGRITFGADVGELIQLMNRRSRRVGIANFALRKWNIQLLMWPRGALPPNDAWQLLIRGPVAEVWAPRNEAGNRLRATLLGQTRHAP